MLIYLITLKIKLTRDLASLLERYNTTRSLLNYTLTSLSEGCEGLVELLSVDEGSLLGASNYIVALKKILRVDPRASLLRSTLSLIISIANKVVKDINGALELKLNLRNLTLVIKL